MLAKVNQPAASTAQVDPGGGWPVLSVAEAITRAHLGDQAQEVEVVEALTLGAGLIVRWMTLRDPLVSPLSDMETMAFARACRLMMMSKLAQDLPVAWQRKSSPQDPEDLESRADWYFDQARQAVTLLTGAKVPSRSSSVLL